jgi:hypothetical protein
MGRRPGLGLSLQEKGMQLQTLPILKRRGREVRFNRIHC